jgi:acetoin utilization deacetylase AcuC-like enzyme
MHIIHSEQHYLHHPRFELLGGKQVELAEIPSRIEWIKQACECKQLGTLLEARDFGIQPILRVHDEAYVAFLRSVWKEMQAADLDSTTFGSAWPVAGMRHDRPPRKLMARLGFYSSDGCSPITEGMWPAAYSAAQTAVTATSSVLDGQDGSLALCRPPGHHAAAAYAGGYCYLNNASIAAQFALDQGARRVAILDVDFHHGNGTQSIFYQRSDVVFASLHADPLDAYPYFLGHADEYGEGAGTGFNFNYPLPLGCGMTQWLIALEQALEKLADTRPEMLVVSLGVSTFKDDPISQFCLDTPDYVLIGKAIARLAVPVVFVLEGGYAVAAIGENVTNVLSGYAQARVESTNHIIKGFAS